MKDNIKKLFAVKTKIALLQEEESLLKASVMDDLKKSKITKIENELGKVTVGSRKIYTYTSRVKEMLEKVEIAKHKEVEKGLAKENITLYLVITPNEQ